MKWQDFLFLIVSIFCVILYITLPADIKEIGLLYMGF
jgi:hypothetical protein